MISETHWDTVCYALRDLRAWLEDPEIRALLPDVPTIDCGTWTGKVVASWWIAPSDFWNKPGRDHNEGTEADVKVMMMRLARLLPKCEKTYDNNGFRLKIQLSEYIRVEVACNRSAVCERRVVGTKHVDALVLPAHDEDVVEWDCHPLLKQD